MITQAKERDFKFSFDAWIDPERIGGKTRQILWSYWFTFKRANLFTGVLGVKV